MINGKTVKKTTPIKSRKTAPIDIAMPKTLTLKNIKGGIVINYDIFNDSTDYDSVRYYRSTDNKNWKKIAPVAYSDYDHVDKTAKNKTVYYYRIALVKNEKEAFSGSKKIKSNVKYACPNGFDRNLPCNAIIDVCYYDSDKWGVYPTMKAAMEAGDVLKEIYDYFNYQPIWVDSWFVTEFTDNLGRSKGFVLFMSRDDIFVPPPPGFVVYDWLVE